MIDLRSRADGAPWEASARATERQGSYRWRSWVPPVISAGLVAWLLRSVSPQALVQAAARQNLPVLIPATLALVLALYLWDAVCLRWLFSQPGRSVRYGTALRVRGTAYLAGVVNYEVGQATVAWLMARALGVSLLPALGRCLVLGLHDVAVLLTLGLVGSLADSGQKGVVLRFSCATGLAVLMVGFLITRLLPQCWRARLGTSRWAGEFGRWRWMQSAQLYGLRVVYVGLIVVYAAGGLALGGVAINRAVLLGVIPLVLLADGLPISVSGLGTRETALLYLLEPKQPEVILAWSLLWSTGLLLGRSAIGLASVSFTGAGPAPEEAHP